MKISVKTVAPDVYALTFGDDEIVLEGDEVKDLLLRITRILVPAGGQIESFEEKAGKFINYIKSANDVGIQHLLGIADEDDILVLLKTAEDDEQLLEKIYGNMSERSCKMITEDLNFKFQEEDIPLKVVKASFKQLSMIARDLEEEGALFCENVADSQSFRAENKEQPE